MRTGPFPDDGRMPGEGDVRSSRGVRRAAALLAAAGIAVAAGCAEEKAPEAVGGPSDRAGTSVERADLPVHVVAYGVCAIDWTIVGGAGAASADGTQPDPPPEVRVTTSVVEGDEFVLAAGGSGGDPDDGREQWQGGFNAGGQGAYDGADGDREQGGGGGGAASVVLKDRNPFVVAPGGTGAGAGGGAGGSTASYFWSAVVPNPDRDYAGPAGSVDAAGTITPEDVACPEPLGPGLPQDVAVTPGVGTLTVSWAPPANTGPNPIASYEVHAVARLENGPVDDERTCTVDASVDRCVLEVGSTFDYQVDVSAVDTEGTRGAIATARSRALHVDYSAPTPDGDPLDARGLDDAASGGPVDVTASGFRPDSPVRVLLFPGNAELTQFGSDANGEVAGSVRLPADLLTPGEHSLVLRGFDRSDGSDRYLRADFTV